MSLLVFDLFCGLGGWSEAFIAQGYRAIGFDIEAHDYGAGGYPGQLVLCDIRSIKGSELVERYGIPSVIVASPPCQEFSYMAMPWSKAKKKEQEIAADPAKRVALTELFNQCFRIQREVSEAAERYIPLIIENVRGAQKWVGKARWNFGSFYLWGDVPALMPIPNAGVKVPSEEGRRTDIGKCARFTSRDCGNEGVKGFTPNGQPLGKHELGRKYGSKSRKRKEVSALIAKIPPALAGWIAKCFKPNNFAAEKITRSETSMTTDEPFLTPPVAARSGNL